MAGDIQYQPQIAALLDRFKAGAQLYAESIEIEDNEAADEGKMSSRAAVQALDAKGPHGRDVLIPLLDDPDPAIRVAGGLRVQSSDGLRLLSVQGRAAWADPPPGEGARAARHSGDGDQPGRRDDVAGD